MKHIYLILIFAGTLLLTSCSNSEKVIDSPDEPTDTIEPKLLSMEFLADKNSQELVLDATCEIIGDSVVHCWIPNFMENKLLTPDFTIAGDHAYINGHQVESGVSIIDFKTPATMLVKSMDKMKQYTVYVHAFTGLPVLWIETEGREEVMSKDIYINAQFTLVEDVESRGAGDVVKVDGKIKGRGNSTWSASKKPYKIKLNAETSWLNEPKDKSWVLLANYFDASKLRNSTAFYMSSISNLDYTPRFHYVEVMMNGRYNGNYQLGDHLKISPDRVNVGDDGFLIEVDGKAMYDDITFKVNHIDYPINIKDPEVTVHDENYEYVKNLLAAADDALFSEKFTDPTEGWQKYLDINSFVDWYLINEITKNMDANFYTSCFMSIKRGDKIKMGPVWDFDLSMGNVYNTDLASHEGLWVIKSQWYTRLFQDSAFVAKVKERFNYFYSHQEDIFDDINQNAQYIKLSVLENDNKWHTLYASTGPSSAIWGSYVNEVQFMKFWLTKRFNWLKTEFSKL